MMVLSLRLNCRHHIGLSRVRYLHGHGDLVDFSQENGPSAHLNDDSGHLHFDTDLGGLNGHVHHLLRGNRDHDDSFLAVELKAPHVRPFH